MSDLTRKYIAELDAGVRDLFASDRWRSYLEFLAKFHRYSANNTIAIYLQRPAASLVASFSDWRRKGRQVRKGERGINMIGYRDLLGLHHAVVVTLPILRCCCQHSVLDSAAPLAPH